MALKFNGTDVPQSGEVRFNNTALAAVKMGATEVWKRQKRSTPAYRLRIHRTLDMPHILPLLIVAQILKLTHSAAQNEDTDALCLVDLAQ